MKIVNKLKHGLIKLLEKHPAGYAVGVFFLDRLDFLLPHEIDYWGFAVLRERGLERYRRILDLGANRGQSARAFLKLLPGWKVTSVEANPLHRARLARIQKRNPNYDFHIFAAGGKSTGEISIHTPYYGPIALHSAAATSLEEATRSVHEAFPRLGGPTRITHDRVPIGAVDDLNLNADFVKMDIQGDELQALRGMETLLKRDQPILLVEVNFGKDGVVPYLESLGYAPYHFIFKERKFAKGLQVYDVHKRNVFFVPECHARLVDG